MQSLRVTPFWLNEARSRVTITFGARRYTETPGIWQDRVSKSDRRCQLPDGELKRHRGGARVLADGYGNLPPATPAEAARVAVERAMACLSPAQRAAIKPRMKWDIVTQVKAVQQRAD